MKKILIFLVLLLVSCSNLDKKDYYYRNSATLNITFGEELEKFKGGYLKISLVGLENGDIIDEKYVYDIEHKKDDEHNQKILVNFKESVENKKILVELYIDVDNDGIYEKRVAKENFEKTKLVKRYFVFELRDKFGVCINNWSN